MVLKKVSKNSIPINNLALGFNVETNFIMN